MPPRCARDDHHGNHRLTGYWWWPPHPRCRPCRLWKSFAEEERFRDARGIRQQFNLVLDKTGSKKQWESSRTTNLKSNGSYRHQGWPDSLAPGGPGEVIVGGYGTCGFLFHRHHVVCDLLRRLGDRNPRTEPAGIAIAQRAGQGIPRLARPHRWPRQALVPTGALSPPRA
jgi:hypothetical protein